VRVETEAVHNVRDVPIADRNAANVSASDLHLTGRRLEESGKQL
jgi:hypothetical protein